MTSPTHAEVVRQALALLDEREGDSVTIGDLCRAAGVCERTLRNAFHDVFGISPKQYVIRHALEQAHQALLATHDARGAVTRAATECGFYELGRFAGAYRHLYGESPSDTVRVALTHAHF